MNNTAALERPPLKLTRAGKFIISHHSLVLIGVSLYLYLFGLPHLDLILFTLGSAHFTGTSNAAMYHRFYSHPTFKLVGIAGVIVEFILLFAATLAWQGSVPVWAYEHRMHHKHVDTDKDPYNVHFGFWWAHMLWLFADRTPLNESVVQDLLKRRMVAFQHKYYDILTFVTNILFALFVGYMCNDYFGAFVFAWGLRLLLTYHSTWLVNSAAHYWGPQPYTLELSARSSLIIALATISGEGWHNSHHCFPNDYRNGILWYHYDPAKWLILTLWLFGIAKNLKRVDQEKYLKKALEVDIKLFEELLESGHAPAHVLKILKELMSVSDTSQLPEALQAHSERLYSLFEPMAKLRRQRMKALSSFELMRAWDMTRQISNQKPIYTIEWNTWKNACKTSLNRKVMPPHA